MKAVVLGAGPCGLSAARRLSARGVETVVVDRMPFVGGASASRPVGDGSARMDFGPHVFHLKNPEVNRFFLDHASGPCPTKKRNERILVRGGLFRYPLEIMEVLTHLTPGHVLYMGSAFLVARLRRAVAPPADTNFETWGVGRFGRPLYEFSCGQYTEKVWGMRPSLLSAKLAQQKLKDLRLRDILAKFVGRRGQEQKQYWEDYVYPEKGIGEVFENMAREIERASGRLALGAGIEGIETDGNRCVAVTVKTPGGRTERFPCDALVNTIPLTHVASALATPGSRGFRLDEAASLRYRGLVLVNVVFEVDRVMPYDWVYLLDPIFRCNRVTEQKNMGGEMIPQGRTVLCFELAATPGDALWDAPDEVLVKVVKEDMGRIDFFRDRVASAFHVSRLDDAYPVYTLDFDRAVVDTLKNLSSAENLFTTGRQGLFLNSDIHDSMELGLKAADAVMEKRGTAEWYRFAWDYVMGKIERKAS